jgi:hypothetical protein
LAMRRALGVFRELGLIEDVGEGATVIDDGWLTSAARKALDESPLFRRCQRRREEAERFVAAMCEWPAPALEDLARDLSFAGWP